MKKLRFSNRTEGELFQDKWCWNCERDKAIWSYWCEKEQKYITEPDWEKGCQILAGVLGLELDDKNYPAEICRGQNGPICTAFIKRSLEDRHK